MLPTIFFHIGQKVQRQSFGKSVRTLKISFADVQCPCFRKIEQWNSGHLPAMTNDLMSFIYEPWWNNSFVHSEVWFIGSDHRGTTTQDSGNVHEWASVALASYY